MGNMTYQTSFTHANPHSPLVRKVQDVRNVSEKERGPARGPRPTSMVDSLPVILHGWSVTHVRRVNGRKAWKASHPMVQVSGGLLQMRTAIAIYMT